MTPLISFLIPTLRERQKKFKSLTDKLFLQIEENNLQNEIEIISIYDNRTIPLSKKRNMMQKMCSGMYFLHLDDDDRVADDYCVSCVTEIKKLIEDKDPMPDVIGYDQMCEVDDRFFIVKCSGQSGMGLTHTGMFAENIPIYTRIPWQYCLWKREKFSSIYRTDVDTNAREDMNWLKKVFLEYPQGFHNIDKILHYYYFKTNGTGEDATTCQ
tara:strand:+ start:3462 stop:4097 length:636 start_codon:yes stop_codon:yes gene_type:complete